MAVGEKFAELREKNSQSGPRNRRAKKLAITAGMVVAVLLAMFLLGRASMRGRVNQANRSLAVAQAELRDRQDELAVMEVDLSRAKSDLSTALSTSAERLRTIQDLGGKLADLRRQKVKPVTETVEVASGIPASLIEDAKTCIAGLVELSVSSPDEETAILDRVEAECNRVLQA